MASASNLWLEGLRSGMSLMQSLGFILRFGAAAAAAAGGAGATGAAGGAGAASTSAATRTKQ